MWHPPHEFGVHLALLRHCAHCQHTDGLENKLCSRTHNVHHRRNLNLPGVLPADATGLQSSTLFTMPLPLPAGASSTMSAPRHAAAAASRGGMYCSAILGVSPVNIPGAPPGNKEGAEAAAAAGAPGSPCGARSPRTGSPRSPRSPTRASGVTSSPGRVPLRVTPVTAPLAVTAPVLWLPSHGLLAYAADNQLVLQEAASGQQSYLTHHVQPITAVALSQDQLQIATATGTPEAGGICDVCVWGIRERRLQRVLRHHTTGVSHLSFSPDGVWLVSVAGASCCLWSLEQGEAVALGIATEVSKLTQRTCHSVCRGSQAMELHHPLTGNGSAVAPSACPIPALLQHTHPLSRTPHRPSTPTTACLVT